MRRGGLDEIIMFSSEAACSRCSIKTHQVWGLRRWQGRDRGGCRGKAPVEEQAWPSSARRSSLVCVGTRGLSPRSSPHRSGQDTRPQSLFPQFYHLWVRLGTTAWTCHPTLPTGTGALRPTEGQGEPEVLREPVVGQRRGPRSRLRGRVGAPGSAHLRVLEEGVLVVDAAPAAVLPRVLVPRPGPTQPGLLPRLVDAQVGRVDQAALDDIGEVSAHILEGHPGVARG